MLFCAWSTPHATGRRISDCSTGGDAGDFVSLSRRTSVSNRRNISNRSQVGSSGRRRMASVETGRLFGGFVFSRNYQHIGIRFFVKLLRSTLSYRWRGHFVEGGVGVRSTIVSIVRFKWGKCRQMGFASVRSRLRNSIHFRPESCGISCQLGRLVDKAHTITASRNHPARLSAKTPSNHDPCRLQPQFV